MSESDVLSQDEVDTLLKGVSEGGVEIEPGDVGTLEYPIPYDFAYPTHKLKTRFPVLEIINDKFAKELAPMLTAFLHQPAEVEIVEFETFKFQEYAQMLPASVSINRVRLDPLPATSLICFEGSLVFTLVDCFFGATSQSGNNPGTRSFTPTEKRIINRTLHKSLQAITAAWQHHFAIQAEFVREEINTEVTNDANPAEVLVVSKFMLKLPLGEGELHIAIPYSSLEVARQALTANIETPEDSDQNWSMEFTDRVIDAKVELQGIIGETDLSLSELMALREGDFIPLGKGSQVTIFSESIPLFEANIAASDGMISAKLVGKDTSYQQ